MGMEKKIERMQEQLDFLAGQHHALNAIVMSLNAISPSSCDELRKAFSALEDGLESQALPVRVSEDFLEGTRRTMSDLRHALEKAPE